MSAPSTSPRVDAERSDVESIAGRYRRTELAVGLLTALFVVGLFLASFVAFSLGPALAVAVVLAVTVRVPVFRRRGTATLRSDADPKAVRRDFAGPTPPVLAAQWANADEVTPATDALGATYEHSSPFALRTVTMVLDVEVSEPDANELDASEPDASDPDANEPDAATTVALDVSVNDRPWGSYTVTIRPSGGNQDGTLVDVALRPTRRFDLRHLPQTLVADRYYADLLAAQGYAVLERDVSTSL